MDRYLNPKEKERYPQWLESQEERRAKIEEMKMCIRDSSNGEKCPICSGARVIAGINDLATLEPLLVKQWSKKNKIKPTEVSIGSHSIRE